MSPSKKKIIFFIRSYDNEYAAGITTKVSNVEDIIPPIIATDKGLFSSEPAPTPKAAGNKAKINVSEVISTGLSLTGHAFISASSILLP